MIVKGVNEWLIKRKGLIAVDVLRADVLLKIRVLSMRLLDGELKYE